jgi:hypothetical protein
MILCDNLILFVVFSTTLFASVFAQKGKIEFPYEFQMFENFDLTSKVFLEEQKLVQKLRDIQSTLKQSRDEIKVIDFLSSKIIALILNRLYLIVLVSTYFCFLLKLDQLYNYLFLEFIEINPVGKQRCL